MSSEIPNDNQEGLPKREAKELTPEVAETLKAKIDAPLHGIYVEIGPGSRSYLNSSIILDAYGSQRRFDTEDSVYVGVDYGKNKADVAEAERLDRQGLGSPDMATTTMLAAERYSDMQALLESQGQENVNFVVADATKDVFQEGTVTEVYASDAIYTPHPPEETAAMLKSIHNSLQDGGLFIDREIAVVNPEDAKNLVAKFYEAGFKEVYVVPARATEQSFGLKSVIYKNFGFDKQTTIIAKK